ncbi:hypothetical protein HMPREF1532_03186 [Bacteroides salyersiae WAL 10018 = DSM 18765 = JCM 12988]|nr:hypothetical protein HMPREF1532_03186 [Bacteroides salyersiae WAL 10018 = DSM 18765 = JCM 12988]
MNIRKDITEFQFHNGTINTSDEENVGVLDNKFQFHNGTINTSNYENQVKHLEFQFHNGTINTLLC